MKPLMSSCFSRISCRSGLIARICPVTSNCFGGGGVREHAADVARSSSPPPQRLRRTRIPHAARIWLTLPNDLGGHLRLQLSGMEGQLLSGEAAGVEDA